MKRELVIASWLFVLLVVSHLRCDPLRAAAVTTDSDVVVDLARVCTSEAGFVSQQTGDCAAIRDVIEYRREPIGQQLGREVTFREALHSYAKRAFDQRRRDHRRWLVHLSRSGDRPDGWPRRWPWESRPFCGTSRTSLITCRRAWLNTIEHARALLDGEPSRCREQPHYWGAPYGVDLLNAEKNEWREVDCGPTANMYWRAW